MTFSKLSPKTGGQNGGQCPVIVKGDLFRSSSDTQLNTGPKGTFLVSALKYRAKLTSTSPWPSIQEESDKGDKSESGLQPEGGDDRYKGIMILLRSHRPSVESGSKSAREPSHPMSAAGSNSTGVKVPWSRNSNARALRSTTLLLQKRIWKNHFYMVTLLSLIFPN